MDRYGLRDKDRQMEWGERKAKPNSVMERKTKIKRKPSISSLCSDVLSTTGAVSESFQSLITFATWRRSHVLADTLAADENLVEEENRKCLISGHLHGRVQQA